jgi:hypothetical protein
MTSHVVGADFLKFLLTPEAVDIAQPPPEESWKDLDFSRYGKTEAEIRHFLEQKAQAQSHTAALSLTGFFYADLLNQAMNQGLIYRLHNPREDGKAYYGVPTQVRQALSLHWQPEPGPVLPNLNGVKASRAALLQRLKNFLQEAADSDSPEICEYAAQVALNAVHQGDLSRDDVPASLLQLAKRLDLVAVPHYAVLTVLLEACLGTPLFKAARHLCDSAVDANLLPAEDVEEVLQPARPKVGNPFMVLG